MKFLHSWEFHQVFSALLFGVTVCSHGVDSLVSFRKIWDVNEIDKLSRRSWRPCQGSLLLACSWHDFTNLAWTCEGMVRGEVCVQLGCCFLKTNQSFSRVLEEHNERRRLLIFGLYGLHHVLGLPEGRGGGDAIIFDNQREVAEEAAQELAITTAAFSNWHPNYILLNSGHILTWLCYIWTVAGHQFVHPSKSTEWKEQQQTFVISKKWIFNLEHRVLRSNFQHMTPKHLQI